MGQQAGVALITFLWPLIVYAMGDICTTDTKRRRSEETARGVNNHTFIVAVGVGVVIRGDVVVIAHRNILHGTSGRVGRGEGDWASGSRHGLEKTTLTKTKTKTKTKTRTKKRKCMPIKTTRSSRIFAYSQCSYSVKQQQQQQQPHQQHDEGRSRATNNSTESIHSPRHFMNKTYIKENESMKQGQGQRREEQQTRIWTDCGQWRGSSWLLMATE